MVSQTSLPSPDLQRLRDTTHNKLHTMTARIFSGWRSGPDNVAIPKTTPPQKNPNISDPISPRKDDNDGGWAGRWTGRYDGSVGTRGPARHPPPKNYLSMTATRPLISCFLPCVRTTLRTLIPWLDFSDKIMLLALVLVRPLRHVKMREEKLWWRLWFFDAQRLLFQDEEQDLSDGPRDAALKLSSV
jgi:hypothetical protein